MSLEEVDGGSGFYARFARPLPSSPEWFPIAVWGAYNQTRSNRDLDASAGINTYVWAGDPAFMADIRADGRFQVIQSETTRTGVDAETAGWLLGDEWDMTGEACPADLNAVKNSLPADGRLRYMNLGKGLALPPGDPAGANGNWWAGAAEQGCWANGVDVASVDMYWFTDPYEADFCCGYKYGDNIRNLRNADASDGVRHPNWAFVEVGEPWGPDAPGPKRSITPNEIRSAVWHSLIAGARGIIYFQHSFGGPCTGDHHVIRSNCEGTRPMVTAVDAQIESLAPVLNSPTVRSGTSASPGIRTMVKWNGHNLYVFAGPTGTASSGRIDIPCVGDATATVLGENRGIPVSAGSLRDQFADANAVHIYRIDGGSTCGLPGPRPAAPSPGSPNTLRSRIGRLPRRVSLRSGRLRVPVTCAKPCTVRSRLTTRATKPLLLGTARSRFDVGHRVLVIRLSRRARRMARRRHRPFAIRLATLLVDPDGRLRRTQRLIARRR